jgi:hypothetical protein
MFFIALICYVWWLTLDFYSKLFGAKIRSTEEDGNKWVIRSSPRNWLSFKREACGLSPGNCLRTIERFDAGARVRPAGAVAKWLPTVCGGKSFNLQERTKPLILG